VRGEFGDFRDERAEGVAGIPLPGYRSRNGLNPQLADSFILDLRTVCLPITALDVFARCILQCLLCQPHGAILPTD
jgi:hypothetical protein